MEQRRKISEREVPQVLQGQQRTDSLRPSLDSVLEIQTEERREDNVIDRDVGEHNLTHGQVSLDEHQIDPQGGSNMKSFRSRESLLIDSVQLDSTESQIPDKGKGLRVEDDNPTASADSNDHMVSPEDDVNLATDPSLQLSLDAGISEPVTTPDEPDGAHSIIILERDYYLLTTNNGTSLSVILTDENGRCRTFIQDGKEVPLTTPFPSAPNVLRESSD